jgi:hypothetical protein
VAEDQTRVYLGCGGDPWGQRRGIRNRLTDEVESSNEACGAERRTCGGWQRYEKTLSHDALRL